MGTQKRESGITLIALIITIIVLVILSTIAIREVYKTKIIDKATEGSQDYANESNNENKIMQNTGNLIDHTVQKLGDIFAGKVEETNVFAKLYTDGTLALSNVDETISGKTLSKSYMIAKGTKFSSASEVPWHNNRSSIKNVEVTGAISPATTAYWFMNCTNLTNANLDKLDTSNVTDMSNMFNGCSILSGISGLRQFRTANVTTMARLFQGCQKLPNLDLLNFDTSNVTDMSYMFYTCSLLNSINGLEKFNTANVTTMNNMFSYCTTITELNLRSFDTKKVRDMSFMFYDCSKLDKISVSDKWSVDSSTVTNDQFTLCKVSEVTKE